MNTYTNILNIVDKGPNSVDPKWNQFLAQLRKDPNFKNEKKNAFYVLMKNRFVTLIQFPILYWKILLKTENSKTPKILTISF